MFHQNSLVINVVPPAYLLTIFMFFIRIFGEEKTISKQCFMHVVIAIKDFFQFLEPQILCQKK